jgi:glycerophosphoryl diester phosphodiesterase
MKEWPYPKILAHRGGGTLAPENTLAAIRLGQSLGYRAHEFDVKLSKDNVAMLLHDATLERTTSGKGRAADALWEALRSLDAGGWHSAEFRGEPLASFEDTAKLMISKGTMANIEIKPTPGLERETGERVAQLTRELWKGAATTPLFSSFSFEALMAAKEAAPEIPRGWLTKEFIEEDWGRLRALEAASMHTNYRMFAPQRIREVHDRGYRVLLYTVNEVPVAEKLLEMGVDGIFTDNLREFAARFPALI